MNSLPDGAMAHVTTAGLRALADAADAGRIELFTPPQAKNEEHLNV